MKIAIINKSDSTGGAAVVSFRLMEALRSLGEDARMIVAEKMTDSPYVISAAPRWKAQGAFLSERLSVFRANGFNRKTLFKIDTGENGLPLRKNEFIKEADAIILNWVNQGMLSLKGIKDLLDLQKPVIWTMHDLWNMTGICHHPGECRNFLGECGECPLLGPNKGPKDLSHKVWERKNRLYGLPSDERLRFVAVSTWLAAKARESCLLKNLPVEVIPNSLPQFSDPQKDRLRTPGSPVTLLFGAARLDDTVKGLPVLIEALNMFSKEYPAMAEKLRLVTFGSIKDPSWLDRIPIRATHLGFIRGEEKIHDVYSRGDILVSASSYETLPTTLVEAQLFGVIPVSFDRGGQADIIDHLSTGFLAHREPDDSASARNLCHALAAAVEKAESEDYLPMLHRMRESAVTRFSPKAVAQKYIDLIRSVDSLSK